MGDSGRCANVNCHNVFPVVRACTGCKEVFYCNRACQRAHWNAGHKLACAAKQDVKLPLRGDVVHKQIMQNFALFKKQNDAQMESIRAAADALVPEKTTPPLKQDVKSPQTELVFVGRLVSTNADGSFTTEIESNRDWIHDVMVASCGLGVKKPAVDKKATCTVVRDFTSPLFGRVSSSNPDGSFSIVAGGSVRLPYDAMLPVVVSASEWEEGQRVHQAKGPLFFKSLNATKNASGSFTLNMPHIGAAMS